MTQAGHHGGWSVVTLSRVEFLAAALLLGVHIFLLGWSATQHSPAGDEIAHLAAGINHWRSGSFDLFIANPPLVRSIAVIPLLAEDVDVDATRYDRSPERRAEFMLGMDLAAEHATSLEKYFTRTRWACIPFSLIGAIICFGWARELFGPASGWFAIALWCFSPSILGHASLITPDAPAAALGAAACYAFWRWLQNRSWAWALVMGVMLGLAALTKGTWVCLFGLWPMMWLVERVSCRQIRLREVAQYLGAICISIEVINVGYLFEGSFTPLGEYSFSSEALSGREPGAPGTEGNNRFRRSWLGKVPVPLPRNYVLGMDYVKTEYERGHPSYLAGESRHGGWWYYYLYAICVKAPLGTLLLGLIAAWVAFRPPWRWVGVRDQLMLITPAVVVIGLVSSQTGFNHHLRYVLPAFPFLFIFASQAAMLFRSPRIFFRALPAAGLLWSVVASLSAYPHNLSYFNELAGGCRNGWRHLNYSNVDWGQDLLFVRRWQEAHPEARPAFVSYAGFVDPKHVGVYHEPARMRSETNDQGRPQCEFMPGWYILSLHRLVEYNSPLRPFLDMTPTDYVGYSMRIYYLPEPMVVSTGDCQFPSRGFTQP